MSATAAGARVLLALKAFSMWSLADVVGEYLDGTCASGLWEARLAREHYNGELTTYSPAYKARGPAGNPAAVGPCDLQLARTRSRGSPT